MRAKRLELKSKNLYLLTETNVEKVLKSMDKLHPDILIVDSIQTMYHNERNTVPGSVTQIRECAGVFIGKAKTENTAVLLVGHVNKEGSIAGTEGSGAYGGYRSLFRGRKPSELPRDPRDQKPFRLHQRARRF